MGWSPSAVIEGIVAIASDQFTAESGVEVNPGNTVTIDLASIAYPDALTAENFHSAVVCGSASGSGRLGAMVELLDSNGTIVFKKTIVGEVSSSLAVPVPLLFGTLGTSAIAITNISSGSVITFDLLLDQETIVPALVVSDDDPLLPASQSGTGTGSVPLTSGSSIGFGPTTDGALVRGIWIEVDLSAISAGGSVQVVDSGGPGGPGGSLLWECPVTWGPQHISKNIPTGPGGYRIYGQLELQVVGGLSATGSAVAGVLY